MIISHKHKFIFIKTVKTAGTSIEIFLSQQCGPQDVLTPIQPPQPPHAPQNDRGLWNPLRELIQQRHLRLTLGQLRRRRRFTNHMAARTVQMRVPAAVWHSYFKFCVERNPWDKTVSHFEMMRARGGGTLTWEAYLAQGQFCLNWPLYTAADSRLLVDQVLRYESLTADLTAVFSRLGISFSGTLGVRAKSSYRHAERARPYQAYYTPAQQAQIAAVFAPEIALHGYSF